MKRRTALAIAHILTSALSVAILPACRSKRAALEDRSPGPIGSVMAAIRDAGTPPSRCITGPPTPAEQEEWRRLQARYDVPSKEQRLSMAELLRLDDHLLVLEVGSRLMDKGHFRGLSAMSRAELNAHLLHMLQLEVNNGGFDQFFFNSAGDCAMQTANAIHDMGLTELDALYARALAKFPNRAPSEDRATRWQELERIPDSEHAWSADDTAFYHLHTETGAAAYVRAHMNDFDLPPKK
jgi:hypothetical protein